MSYDRVGPTVLELIEGRYGAEVELCDAGCASLALLDWLRGQQLMIVIDACMFDGRPGEIRIVEPDLEQLPSGGDTSVHQLGPIETLLIAKHLYPETLPQRIRLVLVETENIDEPTLERACRDVVGIVDREVAQHLAAGGAGP